MNGRWDTKYSGKEYAYGEAPNNYFKEIIDTLPPGKILLPADGESRNGVYSAKKRWTVDAFDQSKQAKEKAMQLAVKNGVNIMYKIIDFGEAKENYIPDYYDAIALIYVHIAHSKRTEYYKMLLSLLKSGGYIILEGFSKEHLEYQQINSSVGGPSDVDMLYSTDEIKTDFPELEIINLEQIEIELSEGAGHKGTGSVIRFFGRKK